MRVSPWEEVPRGEDTPGPGGTCTGKGSSLLAVWVSRCVPEWEGGPLWVAYLSADE